MQYFVESTKLGRHAACGYETQRHIVFGENRKLGWALPSIFEIREAIREPQEVLQSRKNPDTEFHIRPVGKVGRDPGTQWFTLVLIDKVSEFVTTAYNTTSYTQKGDRIWP